VAGKLVFRGDNVKWVRIFAILALAFSLSSAALAPYSSSSLPIAYTDGLPVFPNNSLYSLSVYADPAIGGKASGSASNLIGNERLNISATPAAGYQFSYWYRSSGNCTIANAYSAYTYVSMTPANCVVNAKFTQVVSGLPDLTVSVNAPASENVGNTFNVVMTVRNIGNGSAGSSSMFYNSSNGIGYFNVSALPAGASSTFGQTFACRTPGAFSLAAIADVYKQVAESNENNNYQSISVSCTNQTANNTTVTITPYIISPPDGYISTDGVVTLAYTATASNGQRMSCEIYTKSPGGTSFVRQGGKTIDSGEIANYTAGFGSHGVWSWFVRCLDEPYTGIVGLSETRTFKVTGNYSLHLNCEYNMGFCTMYGVNNSMLEYGQVVEISAVGIPGYKFKRWVNYSCPIANPASANTTITITPPPGIYDCYASGEFERDLSIKYEVYIGINPSPSAGTTTGQGKNYTFNQTVQITAVPNPGYRFKGWVAGDVCLIANKNLSSTTIRVTPSRGTTCYAAANFENVTGNYTLVVNCPSGMGTCYGSASGLAYGQVVPIAAVASPGYQFKQWVDYTCPIANITSANTTIAITPRLNGSTYCHAYAAFSYANVTGNYTLVVNCPSGMGTCYGSASGLAYGQVVPIAAVASPGYQFKQWVDYTCPIANITSANTTIAITPRLNGSTYCHAYAAFSYANVTSKPNLVISSINLPSTVTKGVRAYGSVTTKNIGNASAGASVTSYSIQGQYINSVPVPPLSAGASSTGNITFVCLVAGTYTLKATADSQGAVPESNEADNYLTYTFRCLSSATAQTEAPGSDIFASMGEISEETYAKLMNVLGVYAQGMEK